MSDLLGLQLQPKDLTVLQVCLRGLIVFAIALIMIRVADRRFLSKMSAFDVILGLILSSLLSRAINGSAPFVPTLVAGLVLVCLHRVLAILTFHFHGFGLLLKGKEHVLVEDGQPRASALRAHQITERDLYEELRLNGKVSEVERVQRATLERSGQISVVVQKS